MEHSVTTTGAAAAQGKRAVTDATFAAEVDRHSGVVLVDFGASWCPPCRMMEPVIERLAAEYAGRAKVLTLDVDANPESSARFDVRSLPTFLIFQDGEVAERIVGAVPRGRLSEAIDRLL